MLASPDPMRLYKELEEKELEAIAWVLSDAIRHLRTTGMHTPSDAKEKAAGPAHEMMQEYMDNYFTLKVYFAMQEEAKTSEHATADAGTEIHVSP